MRLKSQVLTVIVAVLLGCSEDQNLRSLKRSSDLVVETSTPLNIQLPDITPLEAEAPDIRSFLTTYYLKLTPGGDECQTETVIEDLGPYQDQASLSYSLDPYCDYQIDLLLGASDTSALRLSGDVTFTEIKPILTSRCVSCHETYGSYEDIFDELSNISFQVENGLMPPDDDLTDFEKASFIAWEAGGYMEQDPNPIPADSLRHQMTEVYYRNNYNSYVYSYLLRRKKFVVYQDTLWLQGEGIDIGLETVELSFKPSE